MKNKPRLIPFLILTCTLSVMSCEEIDDGEYVNPVTLYEKLQGNWSLTDISQIDETGKIAGIAAGCPQAGG